MTTTTGSRQARRGVLALLLPAGLILAEKKKDDKPKKLAAVIAGTVFRDPGFAMRGVEVELLEIRPDGKRGKARKTVTDGRGEFAFSVPAEERKYVVKAGAKGLQTEEKETASTPCARVDVFFTLQPAAQ